MNIENYIRIEVACRDLGVRLIHAALKKIGKLTIAMADWLGAALVIFLFSSLPYAIGQVWTVSKLYGYDTIRYNVVLDALQPDDVLVFELALAAAVIAWVYVLVWYILRPLLNHWLDKLFPRKVEG